MIRLYQGGVPEWLIGADCKSAARKGYVGSNPTPSTINYRGSHIARQVEHVLGKNKS
jgi:hypothetical protein